MPDFNIYEYTDYRKMLRDFYEEKKARQRNFSYRAFSRRAGIRSPNHLKLVIDSQRNLTSSMAVKFSKAMGLTGEADEYFRTVVAFNQAKTHQERQSAYEQMRRLRGYQKAHQLDSRYAVYHSQWYIPAIRELAMRSDFLCDPKWIAQRLTPPIPASEAAKALRVLMDLKLLEADEDGAKVTDEVISTGAVTRNLHVPNFHRTMLQRGIDAIDLFPAEDRDISSLSFCVSLGGLQRVKQKVIAFRKELIALAEEEQKDADQAIHIGLQLFPLSTSKANES